MCNLYTMRKSAAEVAAHFGVNAPTYTNAAAEVYPGAPGMVVREDGGQRTMQSMGWGWPLRLKTMSPTAKPKPVNNIADLQKNMWVGFARKPQWRCIIPLTGFAEAEGPRARRHALGLTSGISRSSPGRDFGATARSGDRFIRA